MMLIAVAVLSVGAGSYWFFGRDSGAERPVALVQGETIRKPRAVIETPSPPRQPTPARPPEDGAVVVQRKPPPEPENTTSGRKPRSRPDKTVTKKPITPMG